MGRLLLLLCLVGGCSNSPAPIGPNAASQEQALSIVWEGAFGMERESRPVSITWWPADGCGEDLNVTGQTLQGACAADSEGSKGDVYIRWEGTFAASSFSRALVMWRQYLMTGNMTKPSADDFTLVNAANADLNDAHL